MNYPPTILKSVKVPASPPSISYWRETLAAFGYSVPGEGTQMGLALEYFILNEGMNVSHKDAKAWIETKYFELTGKKCEDPDKQIRTLYQRRILQKIGNGIYRFEPGSVSEQSGTEFSSMLREQIMARDGYRCVICGLGESDGQELHIDHKIPRERGGQGTLENGQTLCSIHNYRKKNLSQAEMGEKFFQRMLQDAQSGDTSSEAAKAHIEFIEEVLAVYVRYNMLLPTDEEAVD